MKCSKCIYPLQTRILPAFGLPFLCISTTYVLGMNDPFRVGGRGRENEGEVENRKQLICKLLFLKEKVGIKVGIKVSQNWVKTKTKLGLRLLLRNLRLYYSQPRARHATD